MAAGRIVLTTLGSLGDVHPYIALARGLLERGHDVVLATSGRYREKITSLGIPFHAVRPDLHTEHLSAELMARAMHLKTGPRTIFREMVMPAFLETYTDLLRLADETALIVSHPLTLPVRIIAEQRGLKWASSILAPLSLFSAYDPPVLPQQQWLAHLRWLGPWLWKPLMKLGTNSVKSWAEEWYQLRRQLNLPEVGNPLAEAQYSPALNLALFSNVLAEHQPDWPVNTVVTGFLFHDQDAETTVLPPELQAFLEAGPPPVVFTLGSAAVMTAGNFFEQSARAAERLGCRAVLLLGRETTNLPPRELPASIFTTDYAPFSLLFPHAAAVVHQGGIGTTAQTLRAGVPSLVVPFAFDQPDNADRVRQLGCARVLPRDRYEATKIVPELAKLIGESRYGERARDVRRMVCAENGVTTACEALETLLRR